MTTARMAYATAALAAGMLVAGAITLAVLRGPAMLVDLASAAAGFFCL